MNFCLDFHFNSFPWLAKRRERERKNRKHNTRAREKEQTAIEPHTQSSDPANEREKVDSNAPARRSRRREIAQLIAISPSTEIAIDGAISRRVDRDLARAVDRDFAKRRSQDRAVAVAVDREIVDDFFWICVFLLLFQTPENIFRKIF